MWPTTANWADQVILTNNVMLGGHVKVGHRAFVSGAVAVHQFCQIGRLAMVGGQAHINKDVPPYVTVDGLTSRIVGLNMLGLKRAGYSSKEIAGLKEAYRHIFRSRLAWKEILSQLKTDFSEGLAADFYPFLEASTRGILPVRQSPAAGTIRLHKDSSENLIDEEKSFRQPKAS